MKHVVFCVHDRISDIYGQPHTLASVGATIRSFTDEVNRAADDNLLYKHNDDFDLYHLGYFDDADGSFELLPKPKMLISGREAKSVVAPDLSQPRLKGVN